MTDSPSHEAVLNTFKDLESDRVTSADLEEHFECGRRTINNRLSDLEERGRIERIHDGNTNIWQLAPGEPPEPLYDEEILWLRRQYLKAKNIGEASGRLGISLLAGAGFVMSNQVYLTAHNVSLPLIGIEEVAVAAIVGVVGGVIFSLSAVAYLSALVLNRYIERQKQAVH